VVLIGFKINNKITLNHEYTQQFILNIRHIYENTETYRSPLLFRSTILCPNELFPIETLLIKQPPV